MCEAFKDSVVTLCGFRASPRFPFLHFALKLVKNLLDAPSVFVDNDELIGGDFHLVGQVNVGGSIRGIGVGNAPQDFAITGANEVITLDSFVAWVGGVDAVGRANTGHAVSFFPSDKINTSGMLEAAPHAVVETGLVPYVENFAAFWGVVTEAFLGGAFDDSDVMGALFPVIWNT